MTRSPMAMTSDGAPDDERRDELRDRDGHERPRWPRDAAAARSAERLASGRMTPDTWRGVVPDHAPIVPACMTIV